MTKIMVGLILLVEAQDTTTVGTRQEKQEWSREGGYSVQETGFKLFTCTHFDIGLKKQPFIKFVC